METDYTNLELAQALENGEKHLLLKGEVAKTFLAKRKKKRWCKIAGGILAVGGLIAAIPTGGASLAATAVGLTVGTVTITATEILEFLVAQRYLALEQFLLSKVGRLSTKLDQMEFIWI